ncbi:MAG: Y-family DNA polymerase, partial [Paracoccaceae bacterium]
MPNRRILSLWFPRLGAERLLRLGAADSEAPFAVIEETRQMQMIATLSAPASAAGLFPGQPLRDAMAMCPTLLTRPRNPHAEAAFLTTLRRWLGRFSPWVAEASPDGLSADLTGCAHLFGGEAALMERIVQDCAGFGLSVQAAIADTQGAAWALARHAAADSGTHRSGDAIEQEARATRSRAARRRRPAPTAMHSA